jgi:hypothetical protein
MNTTRLHHVGHSGCRDCGALDYHSDDCGYIGPRSSRQVLDYQRNNADEKLTTKDAAWKQRPEGA